MTVNKLVTEAHSMSRAKGWYDGKDAERNIPEMLALIHSEVSEALEAYRDGAMATVTGTGSKPEGFPIEVADIVIRVADLCGYLGINLEAAITEKMAFNSTRSHRHGGKRA